jgi:hypothetical protein
MIFLQNSTLRGGLDSQEAELVPWELNFQVSVMLCKEVRDISR